MATILVADDDADIRQLVSGALEYRGHKTIAVGDGQIALEVCLQGAPDLAILDVMMPHLTGLEVCARIKASEQGAFLPVLILTACDSIQDKVEALEEGADDYLTKPFNVQELLARSQALLRVRELSLALHEKNQQLQSMQAKLVEQERQIAVNQLAGAAAHELGQPLAAALLNCHLLETLSPEDKQYKRARDAIVTDIKRIVALVERLRGIDARKMTSYYGSTSILDLGENDKQE